MKDDNIIWITRNGVHIPISTNQYMNGEIRHKYKVAKMSEDRKRTLYNNLDDENKKRYDDLKKEIKEAYRNNDEKKAKTLRNEREDILIKQAEKEQKEYDKRNKGKTKESETKVESKNNLKNELDEKEIKNIIDKNIREYGQDGRIDIDHNYEKFTEAYIQEMEQKVNRKLNEKEFEYIDGIADSFIKDGFFVSSGSYSLKEYGDKMFDKMEQVDSKLKDNGFDVSVSRSQFQGQLASRYYEKNGVKIRIADHENSKGSKEYFTRDKLYNMSVDDIVKYVEDRYKKGAKK